MPSSTTDLQRLGVYRLSVDILSLLHITIVNVHLDERPQVRLVDSEILKRILVLLAGSIEISGLHED